MQRRVSGLAALAIAGALGVLAWQAPQHALASAQLQLCFAIDASGSIDAGEFALETAGVAAAIEDPSFVPQDGRVEITVVAFATAAVTVVPPTVINSQAAATSVADSVRNTDRSSIGLLTDIAEAIDLCTTQITASAKFTSAPTQVINIATDGQPAGGGDASVARDNAVAAGIDRVDAEAIQPGANVAVLLDLVWPQPGEKVTPPAVPAGDHGFVVNLTSFDAFGPAIEAVIPVLLPPPAPAPVGGVSLDPPQEAPPVDSGGSGAGRLAAEAAAATLIVVVVLVACHRASRRNLQ